MVAQLVEHVTRNDGVTGSIPVYQLQFKSMALQTDVAQTDLRNGIAIARCAPRLLPKSVSVGASIHGFPSDLPHYQPDPKPMCSVSLCIPEHARIFAHAR